MRLLILNNGWTDKMSGGDYHILRIIKNWSKEHKIAFIMPRLGYTYAHDMLLDIYSIYFSSNEEGTTDNNNFKVVIFYLWRILRSSFFKFEESPDIIIASSHLLYDVLPALILCKRLKSKLVVYVHGFFLRTSNKALWKIIATLSEKISLFLCKNADLVFVVNSEIKDSLIAKGFRADKMVIIDNGIEQEFIDSIRVDEKKFDGCFCGRIVEKKGVYDLLDVWEMVLKKFPDSKLVIIGNGSDYSRVVQIVKNKALDKSVMLTGFVSETEKISLIKSSKIFVSASYEESWGIAVSEGMACGLAVVCYNLSAYNIFGDAIIKVNVGNKEQMADAITDLLADNNKQKTLASDAKEIVAKMLNWDKISEEELKEINSL